MEAVIEEVEKVCNPELRAYLLCVDQDPKSFEERCGDIKIRLMQCVEERTNTFDVRKKCSPLADKLQACVSANPTNVDACNHLIEALQECAEHVMAERKK